MKALVLFLMLLPPPAWAREPSKDALSAVTACIELFRTDCWTHEIAGKYHAARQTFADLNAEDFDNVLTILETEKENGCYRLSALLGTFLFFDLIDRQTPQKRTGLLVSFGKRLAQLAENLRKAFVDEQQTAIRLRDPDVRERAAWTREIERKLRQWGLAPNRRDRVRAEIEALVKEGSASTAALARAARILRCPRFLDRDK